MRGLALIAAALGGLGVSGCQGRTETPPEEARAYGELVASLNEHTPGASFARLREFARRNVRYTISASGQHRARRLARADGGRLH